MSIGRRCLKPSSCVTPKAYGSRMGTLLPSHDIYRKSDVMPASSTREARSETDEDGVQLETGEAEPT